MLATTTAISVPAQLPIPTAIPRPSSLFHRVWPPVVSALMMAATVAWASLLVYGLVKLGELAL